MGRRLHRLIPILLAAIALALAAGAVATAHPQSAADSDHDGVLNQNDNCPDAFNSDQRDTDADGDPPRLPTAPSTTGGDACDTDDDGDRVDDALDNCRLVENPGQGDFDGDGEGDLCDNDDDADTIPDVRDNCVKAHNPDQGDRDDDFIGDVCDPEPGPVAPTPSPSPGTPPPAAPGPAGPGAPPAAADRTDPAVTLGVGRTHRLDELQAGLAVPVRLSEACEVTAELTLDARSARRLGFRRSRRTVTIARGVATVGEAGRTYVFARLTKATLRRLGRSRSVRPLLRVTAKDAAGNEATTTRRLRVAA